MTYYIVWSVVGLVIIGLMYVQWKFWLDDPALNQLIKQQIKKQQLAIHNREGPYARELSRREEPKDPYLAAAEAEIEELLA